MLALPVKSAAGVKVAVKTWGSKVLSQLLIVPWGETMSVASKLLPGASLKVKVSLAVWPILSALTSLVMFRVGASASTVISALAIAVLVLPAASV